VRYVKQLFIGLIPAMLGALFAILGSYMAVKTDINTLTVNQETMINENREYREEMKYLHDEFHEQDIRIVVLEEKHR
jgi:hypothetical protein